MMIRLKKTITASATWDIYGTEVVMKHKKEISEEMWIEKIELYRKVLMSKSYIDDNTTLCEFFQFFGGVSFVSIGMCFEKEFKDCFLHYSSVFAREWAESDKRLSSKFIGYQYVFLTMFKHDTIQIQYNFNHILKGFTQNNDFSNLVEQTFCDYWSKKMLMQMNNDMSVSNIAFRVGDARVSRYFMSMPVETSKYLKKLAKTYTDNRQIITKSNLAKFIFENDGHIKFLGVDEKFCELFIQICDEELELQKTKFIAENHLEFKKDVWKLYQMQGVTFKYMNVDFLKVKSITLRQELKQFLKFRFSHNFNANDCKAVSLLKIANILCELNPNIRFFADVTTVDAKKLQLKLENDCTQIQMLEYISMCNILFDYLCSDDNESKLPKPLANPFNSLKMVNVHEFITKTQYIPDDILKNIELHIDEMLSIEIRIFKIFMATGMRAKEIFFLKEDCISKGRYDDRYILKFTPYKVLNARKKQNLGEYHQIYIDNDIKDLIDEQILESSKLRKQINSPYIFIYQHIGKQISMPNAGNYSVKVNKLIKKYNICDKSGTLWNFSTRQCRKTIVVKMIENNATVTDLVYQLGHLNHNTVMKYYAEVKSMKLAELNTDFFKNQFDLILSKENLAEYTEEERKLLYIDFRLSKRRVEFGFCVRKSQESICSYQSKTAHCVSCPNLCTGKQYLPYWRELENSQQQVLDELKKHYIKENITDYEDFARYILEKRKLLAYQNIVKAILEAENECSI